MLINYDVFDVGETLPIVFKIFDGKFCFLKTKTIIKKIVLKIFLYLWELFSFSFFYL
jgi:hypothetical protein